VIAAALRALSPLVLASRSPQRRAILDMLGVEFAVVEPGYEEHDRPGEAPRDLVAEHARGKARSVDAAVVLGVDTIVDVDGRAVGKPADEREARATLALLGGRTHLVHSGLCLRAAGAEAVRVATTEVEFRPLAGDDVDWYVASGEWRERAGSYAVQGAGAALVRAVRGDYQNVVGLPVGALLEAATELVRPCP
jgi:septum formation protein